jgi:hypothetical protein
MAGCKCQTTAAGPDGGLKALKPLELAPSAVTGRGPGTKKLRARIRDLECRDEQWDELEMGTVTL